MSGRTEAGLANWPELASVAGLPPTGWTPRMLHSREDERGDRVVIRLDHPRRPPVIVKQSMRPADRAWLAGSATAQDHAAERLRDHPEARMPRMLAMLPDRLCLLMEAVEGQELAAHVGTADEMRAIHGAGRWLDAFEGTGPVLTRRFQPGNLIGPLLAVAAAVRAGRRRVARPALFLAGVDRLAAQAQVALNLPTLHAPLHGDLSGRNLVLSGACVWGIDPSPGRVGPAVLDVARLLVFLALRTSRHDPGDLAGIVPRAMADPFLSGYRRLAADCPALAIALQARLLCEWVVLPPHATGRPPAVQERFDRIRRRAAQAFA